MKGPVISPNPLYCQKTFTKTVLFNINDGIKEMEISIKKANDYLDNEVTKYMNEKLNTENVRFCRSDRRLINVKISGDNSLLRLHGIIYTDTVTVTYFNKS